LAADESTQSGLNGWQKTVLVVLRFALGWHFFYQGFGKLIAPYWSAEGYLKASWGPFARIAASPTLLAIADYTTMWALVILGVCLMVGLFSRLAAVGGALLLGMIYAAVPPLDYTGFVIATSQGTELYVDKTLIEIMALLVVASFRTGHILGLDILVDYWRTRS
jgi:thiosulfate dehydrogenase [quinone] large subunit